MVVLNLPGPAMCMTGSTKELSLALPFKREGRGGGGINWPLLALPGGALEGGGINWPPLALLGGALDGGSINWILSDGGGMVCAPD